MYAKLPALMSQYQKSQSLSVSIPKVSKGIVVLHQPDDFNVDLVFLQRPGEALTDAWRDPVCSRSWPEELLTHDLPEARLLAYSYGDLPSPSSSGHNVRGIASDFLNELTTLRGTTANPTKPIVLVCHSLGGILAIEALRISRSSADLSQRCLFNFTTGIIFLGTPLQSESRSQWAEILRKLDHTHDGRDLPLDSLVQYITNDYPQVLQEIVRGFSAVLAARLHNGRDIRLASFFESRVSHLGMVVPEKYTKRMGTLSGQLSRDHFNLHKFSGPKDPDYVKILHELIAITRAREGDPKGQEVQVRKSLKYIHERLFKALEPTNATERNIPEPAPGTCEWIFKDPDYQTWLAGENYEKSWGLLWIKGKPGSGKSTLMKNLVSRHRIQAANSKDICLNFAFSAQGTYLERSRLGLYRSLLHQLLEQSEQRSLKIVEKFNRKELSSSTGHIQLDSKELSQWFHSALAESSMPTQRVFILIDALDECDNEEARQLVTSFEDAAALASSKGTNLNICFSSRHYPIITTRNGLEIRIEEKSNEDVKHFVMQSLSNLVQLRGQRENQEIPNDLMELVLRKAHGMFLWVRLAMSLLKMLFHEDTAMPLAEVRAALQVLPEGLMSTYDAIIARISESHKSENLALFRWVAFASRPLTMEELWAALQIATSDSRTNVAIKKYSRVSESEDSLEMRIKSRCGGLLEVGTDKRVRLLHRSVRDYLSSSTAWENLGSPSGTDHTLQANQMIAKTCIQYLLFQDLDSSFRLPKSKRLFGPDGLEASLRLSKPSPILTIQFAPYVTENVFLHMDRGGMLTPESNTLQESMRRLQSPHRRLLEAWLAVYQATGHMWSHEQRVDIFQRALRPVADHPNLFELFPEELSVAEGPHDTLPRFASKKSQLQTLREDCFIELGSLHNALENDTDVATNVSFANVAVHWGLASFMSLNFEQIPPLSQVFVLFGPPKYAKGTTCGEYVEGRWPKAGIEFLQVLDEGLKAVKKVPRSAPGHYQCNTMIEDLSITFSWRGPDKVGELELALLSVHGPKNAVAGLVELLAWLTSALRIPGSEDSALSKSDVFVDFYREDQDATLACDIYVKPLVPITEDESSCWHSLFKTAVLPAEFHSVRTFRKSGLAQFAARALSLVGVFRGPERQGTGLEISLDRMAHLAGAATVVYHEDGLVLLGYSTILVPICWLPNGGIQWHLLKSSNGRKISLWSINNECPNRLKIRNAKVIQDSTYHFLGLWPNAKVVLGTRNAQYRALHRVECKNKSWYLSLKAITFSLGSGGLGIIGPTIGASCEFPGTMIKGDPYKEHLQSMLIDYKKEPIILYDPTADERRAWLAPTLSVILHMVHLFIKEHGLEYTPPFADLVADGGQAAWDALNGRQDDLILNNGRSEDTQFRLSDLLKKWCINIRRMEPNPTQTYRGNRIQGYDFVDLVAEPDVKLKQTEWVLSGSRNQTQAEGWVYLTKKVPVLICSGLGDLIVPDCISTNGFEKGKDLLAAPLICLEAISRFEGNFEQGELSAKWAWRSLHSAFGDCHCNNHSCDRTQYIIPKGAYNAILRPPENISDYRNGVIIIGRFRNTIKKAPNSTTPS